LQKKAQVSHFHGNKTGREHFLGKKHLMDVIMRRGRDKIHLTRDSVFFVLFLFFSIDHGRVGAGERGGERHYCECSSINELSVTG